MAQAPHLNDAQQELFFEAAQRGDLAAVQRYVELPDVYANIAFWNAVYSAKRLGVPVREVSRGSSQWYYHMECNDNLFSSVIVNTGQVEVFRWFLARAQLERFGETLRWNIEHTLHGLVSSRNHPASREMVEILLESPLFQEVMEDNERRYALGVVFNTVVVHGYHAWVGPLLAYGADPHLRGECEAPLNAIMYQGGVKTLSVLLAHYAWLEGKHLQLNLRDQSTETVSDMLRAVADANARVPGNDSEGIGACDAGRVLHHMAAACFREPVRFLLDKGFADVNARDARGRTPAMVAGSLDRLFVNGGHTKRRVLELLFDRGASVHAVDIWGRGVLHYAVLDQQDDSIESLCVCLERGADPNLRDIYGQTPMAALLTFFQEDKLRQKRQVLALLLGAGADPFAGDNKGVSAVEMLARSETGRAFLSDHKGFFRRSPPPLSRSTRM